MLSHNVQRVASLLLLLASVVSARTAQAQDDGAPTPLPPYHCAGLDPSRSVVRDSAIFFSDVPTEGPILLPYYWSEDYGQQFTTMAITPEEALSQVTVLVRDSTGNVVSGMPGSVNGSFWSWYPEAPLAPGTYTVELQGSEFITLGDCLVHFTPARIPIEVKTSSVVNWRDEADLTLADSWEVMRPAVIDCCTVVPEHCLDGVDCVQCWDRTTLPVVNAEWTGEGLLWLEMEIAPVSNGLVRLSAGTNSTVVQFGLKEFGEVCVEGSIGVPGEAPTRTVERCSTITSSRFAEVAGRSRVDVESCAQAPDVEEGTRGLLVMRGATEAEARSLVESSPYVVGEGFVPMGTQAGDTSNESSAATDRDGAMPSAADQDRAGRGNVSRSSSDVNGNSNGELDTAHKPEIAAGEAGATETVSAASPVPSSSRSLDCAVSQGSPPGRRSPPTWFGWLFLAVAGLARRRTRRPPL